MELAGKTSPDAGKTEADLTIAGTARRAGELDACAPARQVEWRQRPGKGWTESAGRRGRRRQTRSCAAGLLRGAGGPVEVAGGLEKSRRCSRYILRVGEAAAERIRGRHLSVGDEEDERLAAAGVRTASRRSWGRARDGCAVAVGSCAGLRSRWNGGRRLAGIHGLRENLEEKKGDSGEKKMGLAIHMLDKITAHHMISNCTEIGH